MPVKFNLIDTNGNSVQAGVIPWIVPIQGPALAAPVTETVYTDQPTSGSEYKWSGDHYQYNWKTSKSQSGYWYYLFVLLPGGTVYSTVIGLH